MPMDLSDQMLDNVYIKNKTRNTCIFYAVMMLVVNTPINADESAPQRRIGQELRGGMDAAGKSRQNASSREDTLQRQDSASNRAFMPLAAQSGSASRNQIAATPNLATQYNDRLSADVTGNLPGARQVSYVSFDQNLDGVITEVAKLSGYIPSLSRDVRGKATNGKLSGSATDILRDLSQANGLVMMREGTRLFVAHESESLLRYVRTNAEGPDRIREVLRGIDVDDLDRRVKVDEAAGLVQINAPPSISERIETILINAQRSTREGATGISIIRFGVHNTKN
jgi:hypothetical protein